MNTRVFLTGQRGRRLLRLVQGHVRLISRGRRRNRRVPGERADDRAVQEIQERSVLVRVDRRRGPV